MSTVEPSAITFRPLDDRDLPRMHRWLNDPAVVEWWEGDDVSWSGVLADYSTEARAFRGDRTEHYIALLDGEPLGWIQCYDADDDPDETAPWRTLGVGTSVAGIDYLVGSADDRGSGLGSAMIAAFVRDIVFAGHDWQQAAASPFDANVASWRALENAGFRSLGTFDDPDGPCRLMVIDRDNRGQTPPVPHGTGGV